MIYCLDFHPKALKEWHGLNHSIKQQFHKKLKTRLSNPKVTKDKLSGYTVDGYEGGVTENFNLLQVKIDTNVNKEWYYGESEISDTKGAVGGLYLQRERLNGNRT